MPTNTYDALLSIGEELNSVLASDLLLDRIMDMAMGAVEAERGFLLLKSTGESEFKAVTARNISSDIIASIRDLSSSVVNKVLAEGEPLLAVDAQEDQRFSGAASIMLHNIRSVMCTPIVSNTSLIGAIYMDSRSGAGKFNQENLLFLQAFARQAAIALSNAAEFERLSTENKQLRRDIASTTIAPDIVGKSAGIKTVLSTIQDVAESNVSVLIEGESGTGKELVARAIHNNSLRNEKLFIPLFCGNLSENLLESELFGHKKGSFTGASEDKPGLFEEADGGTLFLDEIADISPTVQTKLLRVLQEGEIKRVGENSMRKVDVRILSATNKDLWEESQAGRFREDLFYRLNVISLKIPPLRERPSDIPLLAEHFLKKFQARANKSLKLTADAIQSLKGYHWPGNIRELENAMERAVILTKNQKVGGESFQLNRPQKMNTLIGKPLKEIEKHVILKTLEITDDNRTKAADLLGVSRRWLQYRLKEWGLVDED
ncbi:MAG: sigma-54 interaction domain-containing protein [Calditrichia bacterium]